MKNLAIYVHYSSRLEIEEYEKFFINFLQQSFEVQFISNSPLSADSDSWLKKKSIPCEKRENCGFDMGAFKDYLLTNKETLKGYETILLTNNSFYAPIGDFPTPDRLLNGKDFFGWYLHPRVGSIPEHLQSYFLLFGKRIISSGKLLSFFSSFSYPRNYDQAVAIETIFTKTLQRLGFTYSFVSDYNKIKGLFPNPSILTPDLLLDSGVPLIKRKAFNLEYDYFLENSYGDHPRKSIEKACALGYPIHNIYKDLLNIPQSQSFPHLPHFYILEADGSEEFSISRKIGLILYVYFEDLVEQNTQIIKNFSEINASILLVSPSQTLLKKYENIWGNVCNYTLMENRGRNEYAYFVCGKSFLEENDFTCLLHDKKSSGETPAIRGFDWNAFCLDNLVASKIYILNVINEFEKHPEIGLLFPPPPVFSKWRFVQNTIWQNPNNLRWAKVLYKKLDLKVPFDEYPLVPFGTMFWLRKDALAALTKRELPDSFFPKEPLPADGSILHALERMYSMIAQNEGFFSGWIMNKSSAERYILNLFTLYNSLGRHGETANFTTQQFNSPGIKVSARLFSTAIQKRLRKEFMKIWKKIQLT